jgi:hypothetical protein
MSKHYYNYFYRVVNLITENFYYGVHKTSNLNDMYMGSGKYIKNAIKKYGKENFKREILKFFNTFEEALDYEAKIVNDNVLNDPKCYNLKIGGKGGSAKGRISPMKNKHHSEITRKKISNSEKGISKNKGMRMSDITKRKISLNNGMRNNGYLVSGNKNGMFNKTKEKNPNYNTIWIYNKDLNYTKRIDKTLLDEYLLKGWVKGRKTKAT